MHPPILIQTNYPDSRFFTQLHGVFKCGFSSVSLVLPLFWNFRTLVCNWRLICPYQQQGDTLISNKALGKRVQRRCTRGRGDFRNAAMARGRAQKALRSKQRGGGTFTVTERTEEPATEALPSWPTKGYSGGRYAGPHRGRRGGGFLHRGRNNHNRPSPSSSSPSQVSFPSSSSSSSSTTSSYPSLSLAQSSPSPSTPTSPTAQMPLPPPRRPPYRGRARFVTSPSKRASQNQQLHPQVIPPWKLWESVAINLSNVPPEVNTFILWQAFMKEGNICSIDLFEDFHGNREPRGKLRFRCVIQLSQLVQFSLTRVGLLPRPISGERVPTRSLSPLDRPRLSPSPWTSSDRTMRFRARSDLMFDIRRH